VPKPDGRTELGAAIRTQRKALGLTQAQVCTEIAKLGGQCTKQHLSSIELGNGWPSSELTRMLQKVLNAEGRFVRLLRRAKVPEQLDDLAADIVVTCHLFFPLYVDGEHIIDQPRHPVEFDVVPGERIGATRRGKSLYAFPFRVLLLHEEHSLQVTNLSELAAWRKQQIGRRLTATIEHAQKRGISAASADCDPYCFSLFVIEKHPWTDQVHQKHSAQLMAMPSILLDVSPEDFDEHSSRLISDGIPTTGLVDFSVPESHYAYAGWAAVAVTNMSGRQSIVDSLIELELQVQALWCYSSNVEYLGACTSDEFGDAFLRRAKRRLQQPRSTEHTSVRHMREAVVWSSRIGETISGALAALRSE
jgi:transcriptional regulator with XRE-family HTH domain